MADTHVDGDVIPRGDGQRDGDPVRGGCPRCAGVRLKGDVILAAVVGEISRTPVGPWQTKDYRGEAPARASHDSAGIAQDKEES